MHAPSTHVAENHESYSQWGEDRLVLSLFSEQNGGYFLEAGAYHPVELSQTYLLEQHGWRGILVEPMPDREEDFRTLRPSAQLVRKALGAPDQVAKELTLVVPHGEMALVRVLQDGERAADGERVVKVPMTTLDNVLRDAQLPRLDYLSLDLEGYEVEALRGLNFQRWKPALIVIEDRVNNLVQHRFLKSKGYKLVYRTGSNNWYVPSGTSFPHDTWIVRLKLLRKMYLAMPLRWLRSLIRTLRGRRT